MLLAYLSVSKLDSLIDNTINKQYYGRQDIKNNVYFDKKIYIYMNEKNEI